MQNFMWDGASRVIFGKGTEAETGKWVKKYGGTRVMLHYGGGNIKKTGVFDRVARALKSEGIDMVEFGGVVPNPVLSKVREGIEFCRKTGADFILPVGGGSVIDSAKAIAVGVPYSGDVWDFAEGKARPEKALPIGVVLTLPAAGSETSQYTVITNEKTLLKRDVVLENNEIIRPKFAILNPEFSFTLSDFQTGCGIVDIMAHGMERYFTRVKNVDLSDKLLENLIKSVMKNGLIVMKEPENYNARAEIMWAGSIVHNDILGVGRGGDWISHRIGMALSALYDTAHGATLSMIFPSWMEYMYRQYPEPFVKLAVNVLGVEYDFESEERTILEGIRRLRDYYRAIGMPTTLREGNIPIDNFTKVAELTEKIGDIKKIDNKDVIEILKLAQ
ncbi:MAG: iron-containing alcohol dehydrogenase [Actinobacteria bacterium]|nr:iron-containing alcohol dehydrogenase [Actinomycetota bacterium]